MNCVDITVKVSQLSVGFYHIQINGDHGERVLEGNLQFNAGDLSWGSFSLLSHE